ncbi:hypothetical protein BvCmsNSNP012_02718 [Escherichia coli]|nr:hypothetical protein BvCmsNSNP012_02718 [Escherichia coli]
MFLASLIQPNEDIRILRLRAFLRMIRIGEGIIQEDGYWYKITDFSKHPNIRHEANGVVSTALEFINFYTKYGEICNVDIHFQISVRAIKVSVV